mgnify:CR=1 FL=1|jgi:cystathionine gamma-lyase
MKFGTKAIHAGLTPDEGTGAIMTPIFQTSTYVQDGPGGHKGYEYSRTQNPTRDALQRNLAALEGGQHGLCFSSGMAAIDSLAKIFSPGDEIISVNDLYGGTYRLFTKVYEGFGLKFKFLDLTDINELSEHISSNTKMVWVETPTNPLLRIIDIKKAAEIAHANGALLAVDNTFATPYLQLPLSLGADIVMHSITKYIGGHSDVIMGCLVVKDDELAERLAFIQNSCGAVPGPMDSFLVLRGIKTLHLRMKAHSQNGAIMATYLKSHPAVDKVYYPGLENHPNHEIARTQMRDFGGMLSFTLKSGREEDAVKVLKSTKFFACAESLGGVESLIGHPASMTHASIPKEERERNGVVDSLIRLSVGIEDPEDLLEDLSQALKVVTLEKA